MMDNLDAPWSSFQYRTDGTPLLLPSVLFSTSPLQALELQSFGACPFQRHVLSISPPLSLSICLSLPLLPRAGGGRGVCLDMNAVVANLAAPFPPPPAPFARGGGCRSTGLQDMFIPAAKVVRGHGLGVWANGPHVTPALPPPLPRFLPSLSPDPDPIRCPP